MSDNIDLARGAVNGADELSVQLIQPADMPAVVRIVWPTSPTVTAPARYLEIASTAMRLLAEATTRLTRIKASKHL